jgi:hypothetical protein
MAVFIKSLLDQLVDAITEPHEQRQLRPDLLSEEW